MSYRIAPAPADADRGPAPWAGPDVPRFVVVNPAGRPVSLAWPVEQAEALAATLDGAAAAARRAAPTAQAPDPRPASPRKARPPAPAPAPGPGPGPRQGELF